MPKANLSGAQPALLRSMLFVPGHKLRWLDSAAAAGPDAIIIDLEDSVPEGDKPLARGEIAEALARATGYPPIFVRVNEWGRGALLQDLFAVVQGGLAGVVIPKVVGADDVYALSLMLDELESIRGLLSKDIDILPLVETASAIVNLGAICRSSPRVRHVHGVGAGRGGDFYRALGARWTVEGFEHLYSSTRTVIEARAAGIRNIIASGSAEIQDLAEVRATLSFTRDLGATGAMAIHPSQVAVIHDVFTPSQAEIDEASEVVAALSDAIAAGHGAVSHKGRMIDYAHARSCIEVLDRARLAGVYNGAIPDFDLGPETEVDSKPRLEL